MKFGIVVLPGSNCDHDCYHAVKHVMGQEAEYIWHKATELKSFDCIVFPGGFSYGDYLRTGAIAKFSPVLKEIKKFADKGGLVLGICNGFQILCETGLLPGVLMRNSGLKFICKSVTLRIENVNTPFTTLYSEGQLLDIPVAHADGNYFADNETLKSMSGNGQIVLRYSTKDGDINSEANPNGSVGNIAGITNEKKNVFGLMPHPERVMESSLGGVDGYALFESIVKAVS